MFQMNLITMFQMNMITMFQMNMIRWTMNLVGKRVSIEEYTMSYTGLYPLSLIEYKRDAGSIW